MKRIDILRQSREGMVETRRKLIEELKNTEPQDRIWIERELTNLDRRIFNYSEKIEMLLDL